MRVRINSRDGRTRIRVQERLGDLAWSLMLPMTLGGGGGGLAIILSLGGPEFGWLAAGLVGAGWVGGMHVLARTIFRAVSRKKRTDLEGLSNRIAAIVTESARDHLDGGRTPPALPS